MREAGTLGRKVMSINELGEVDIRWFEQYETLIGPGLRPSDFGITLTVSQMASVIGADETIEQLFAASNSKADEWDFWLKLYFFN